MKLWGDTFSFFDYGKVSIFIFVVSIIFMATYGKKILAKLDTPKSEKVESSQEHTSIKYDKKKAPIAITIFVLVIFFMVMGPLWKNIFPSLAGYFKAVPLTAYAVMLSMKPALINTGAAKFIGDAMISASSSVSINPNYAILIALILISVIVTNFMSNTATATLFAPIALDVSIILQCNPAPLLIGVGLACSACFLTPVATPPNTLVLGPGKYSFMDYIKSGWLLQLIVVIMLIVLIPIFFPF